MVLRFWPNNSGAEAVAREVERSTHLLTALSSEEPPRPREKKVFLLYLNENTFTDGGALADQVRAALRARVRIVLVHENGPDAGACEFRTLFLTTPQDLLDEKLYGPLAVAWHEHPYRAASIRLVAEEMASQL